MRAINNHYYHMPGLTKGGREGGGGLSPQKRTINNASAVSHSFFF